MNTLDTAYYNNPRRLKAGWSPLALNEHKNSKSKSRPRSPNVAGATERLMMPKYTSTRIMNYVSNTLITRSGTSMHQMKSGGRGFLAWQRDPHSSSGCPHQPMTWASPPQQESIMSIMLPATLLPTKNQLPPQLWDLVELNVLWRSTPSEQKLRAQSHSQPNTPTTAHQLLTSQQN